MKKVIIAAMIVCSVFSNCKACNLTPAEKAIIYAKCHAEQNRRILPEPLKRVVVRVSSASAKVNELCEILFVVEKNA